MKTNTNILKIWWIVCWLTTAISSHANKELSLVFQNNENIQKTIPYAQSQKITKDADFEQEYASRKNLESLAFDDVGLGLFKEWASFTTFITPVVVQRSVFDEYQWKFLIKKNSTNAAGKQEYILYLPDSMKIYELPAIIKKVNELTFGEHMPNYASTIEIQHKIAHTVQYLSSIKNESNAADVEIAIKKYKELFSQYFPDKDIEKIDIQKNIDQEYFDEIKKIWSHTDVVNAVEEVVIESLYKHLFESFFEQWADMVAEIDEIKKAIPIEENKKQLDIVRKTKNKVLIEKKEKEVVNKIIATMHAFYKKHNTSYSTEFQKGRPTNIVYSKSVNCLGLTIMGHQLLNELGIDHQVRLMFGHIVLSVKLGNGKEYFFDATKYDTIKEQTSIEVHNTAEKLQVDNDTIFTIVGDNERLMMSSIIFNKRNDITTLKTEDQIKYIEKAVELTARKVPIFLFVLANAYIDNKEYKKALSVIEEAIQLAPDRRLFWYVKKEVLYKQNIFDHRYTEAINMVNKYKIKK